jgi:hypothetical protein
MYRDSNHSEMVIILYTFNLKQIFELQVVVTVYDCLQFLRCIGRLRIRVCLLRCDF